MGGSQQKNSCRLAEMWYGRFSEFDEGWVDKPPKSRFAALDGPHCASRAVLEV